MSRKNIRNDRNLFFKPDQPVRAYRDCLIKSRSHNFRIVLYDSVKHPSPNTLRLRNQSGFHQIFLRSVKEEDIRTYSRNRKTETSIAENSNTAKNFAQNRNHHCQTFFSVQNLFLLFYFYTSKLVLNFFLT